MQKFKLQRSTFFFRIFTSYIAIILVCAIIIDVLNNRYIAQNSLADIKQNLKVNAQFLSSVSKPFILNNKTEELQIEVHKLGRQTGSRLSVISPTGIVLADSEEKPDNMDNHANRPEVIKAMQDQLGEARRFSNTLNLDMQYLALAVHHDNKVVAVVRSSLPLDVIQGKQRQLEKYIFLGSVIAAFAALVVGYFLAGKFSAPVIEIKKGAEAIALGNYQHRIYINDQDELGELAESFNRMAESSQLRVDKITHDRNQLATILSGLVEGVIAIDDEQKIIHINEAGARLIGISAPASIGLPAWECINISEINHILEEVITQGGDLQKQLRIPGQEKDTVIEVYGAAIDNKEGIHGAVLVLHDISNIEHLERIRRDFVVNASHELKTPITAIRGIIETIIDDKDMSEEVLSRFIHKAHTQTERLVSIVTDLMALSRLEAGRSSEQVPLVIQSVLKQSFNSFKAISLDKGVKLSGNFNDDSQQFRTIGDIQALEQLFDNLIDNAIKYTPEGGEVKLNCELQNGKIFISVSDTGIGLSKEDQAKIFERFYRVDKGRSRELGGTGLGLAIVKHIAELHKGEVSITSQPGKGSTFTVILPKI